MHRNVINEFFTFLCKFQYEKAKACAEKFKDSNNKIMIQLQTAFTHLINGEKYFNNLVFLNMKSISKITVGTFLNSPV